MAGMNTGGWWDNYGGTGGPWGPQPSTAPGQPPPPPPPGLKGAFPEQYQDFLDALGYSQTGLQGDIGALGDIYGRYGTLYDQFGQIAQGNDPLLQRLQAQGVDQTRGNMARMGITGSVAQNEMNRTGQSYDAMNLQRRDQALQGQAGILGGQTGVVGQRSDTYGAYAGNAALPLGLDIAWKAAENQGRGNGGGGGPTVICTVLWNRGDLPMDVYLADCEYGRHAPWAMKVGYWAWGHAVAAAMRRWRLVYLALRPLARAWAFDMHQRTRSGKRGTWIGRVLSDIGEPTCLYLGRAILALKGLREAA